MPQPEHQGRQDDPYRSTLILGQGHLVEGDLRTDDPDGEIDLDGQNRPHETPESQQYGDSVPANLHSKMV